MIVAIASGKGGTGKTFVSVNLAYSKESSILLLDCDVEEPNDRLFLQATEKERHRISQMVPQVNESVCDGCGLCSRVCEYNALAVIAKNVLVFEDLCHSCGSCTTLCPTQALVEVPHEIGTLGIFQRDHITIVEGELDVGKALAVPIIRKVKQEGIERSSSIDDIIIDAPPGTSCPMVWATTDSDFVVLVAEPTPFGLHDLQLAVRTVQELGIPFGVVINKDGLGDDRVGLYCIENHIPILARIPHDRKIAHIYAQGCLLVESVPEYQKVFSSLWKSIELLVQVESKRREVNS